MKKYFGLVWGLWALVLAGCYESDHPVSDPASAKVDERLVGSWKAILPQAADQSEAVTFFISKGPRGWLQAKSVETGKGDPKETDYRLITSAVRDKRYLSVQSKSPGEKSFPKGRYQLYLYEVKERELVIYPIDEPTLMALVKAKGFKNSVEGDNVHLHLPPKELAALLGDPQNAVLFQTKPLRLKQ